MAFGGLLCQSGEQAAASYSVFSCFPDQPLTISHTQTQPKPAPLSENNWSSAATQERSESAGFIRRSGVVGAVAGGAAAGARAGAAAIAARGAVGTARGPVAPVAAVALAARRLRPPASRGASAHRRPAANRQSVSRTVSISCDKSANLQHLASKNDIGQAKCNYYPLDNELGLSEGAEERHLSTP